MNYTFDMHNKFLFTVITKSYFSLSYVGIYYMLHKICNPVNFYQIYVLLLKCFNFKLSINLIAMAMVVLWKPDKVLPKCKYP